MKFLQTDDCYNFCNIFPRSSRGLRRHCIARSAIQKSFRQLWNLWGVYTKAVQWQLMSLQSSSTAFELIWGTRGEFSKLLNLFLEGTGKTDPENVQGVCMEYIAASEGGCFVQANIFPVHYWHCRWIYGWGDCQEECRETI